MPPSAPPPTSPAPASDPRLRDSDRPGRALRRVLWWLLAWTALVLGLIGVVLPGLPTTPFILLAAYAAARGSPRLAAWLHGHRQFGPMISDWQAHGAVSRRAKWLATVAMAACVPVLWWFSPNAWAHWPPIGVMAVVGLWLWRRPEGPPGVASEGNRDAPV
ncbi:MAG: YbaN family protein [Xanthomonadales bacterium]|nr:YbaN family protein [Xanthomonadales bacterium]